MESKNRLKILVLLVIISFVSTVAGDDEEVDDIYESFHLNASTPSIKFSRKTPLPDKVDKLKYSILGDVGCEIQLTCKVDLEDNKDCTNEYLLITDGGFAFEKVCGTVNIKGARARKGLRDLFLILETQGNKPGSISCSAKCVEPGSDSGYRLSKNYTKKFDSRCVCGLQNEDNRIVGGEDAKKFEFPWQAAIVFPNTRSPTCGGTLINDRYILTAAHCFWFDQKKPEDVDILIRGHVLDMTKKKGAKNVTLGEEGSIQSPGHNLSRVSDEHEKTLRFKVKEIINHPFFTEFYDYDYALLRLDGKVKLHGGEGITPVCLPPVDTFDSLNWEGKNMTVVGWGMAAENAGGTTRILQKLEVPFITYDTCSTWLPNMLSQRMLCAGFEDGVKDACTGDSGGPLIHKMPTKQWWQLGIVSWGEGCARFRKPGIYSRVTEMMQWIRFHTRDAKWCKDLK